MRPLTIALALGLGACTVLPGDGPWMGGAQAARARVKIPDVSLASMITVASVSALMVTLRSECVSLWDDACRWLRLARQVNWAER
jgi:hypothetical protein